ncbi:MAG TPA: multicopper oxidase family protein [Longimicrobiales bacterium]|nr:multicopper oxidase family protein [Longimicrobiales bacterium]
MYLRDSHTPPRGPAAAAALLVAAGAAFAAPDGGAPPCEESDGRDGRPSADLYCIVLVPTPDLRGVEAEVALRRAPSPFSLSVTAQGTPRYTPVVRIAGLPAPATLGEYRAYVAWVASPTLSTVERLGVVGNGETTLPVVDLDKFLILVSAEPSADVAERTGRMALRGFSPSTRRQPADVLEFAFGSGGEPEARAAAPAGAGVAAVTDSHAHGHAPGSAGAAWPMPPMPEGLAMLPALMALDPPPVTAYLPSVDDPAAIPAARPRELARLADGDTLALEAGYVRQTRWGREFIGYGFNGQVPGPLVHVPRDAEIVVRFRNSIDWPATVHWHGVRVENRFDGVPHVTQEPVAPGDSFTYRIRFPDEGIYWYHPHHREDVLKELGLYGNLLVDPTEPDYWGPANREEVVVLDDFLMGDDGPFPLGLEGATHAFMGRFGNIFLVNGEPAYRLAVDRGEVVRFYFTNVSNTRTFNISFPGARMKVTGSDIGGFEREAWVESVVIAPAERYVVHVRFDRPGAVPLLNAVRGVDHLFGVYFPETDTLGVVAVGDRAAETDHARSFAALRENPYVRAAVAGLRRHADRPVDRELVLTLETGELPFVVDRLMRLDSAYFDPVEWSGTMPMMNWASTAAEVRWILRDPATGRENMDIDWRFRVGDVVKLRLRNERRVLHGMHHPIHIHGQRFLVLAVDGVANDNLVWKDTVLLPAGSTADLLLEVSNPGTWMIHCHVSEHLETGMHMTFTAGGA